MGLSTASIVPISKKEAKKNHKKAIYYKTNDTYTYKPELKIKINKKRDHAMLVYYLCV